MPACTFARFWLPPCNHTILSNDSCSPPTYSDSTCRSVCECFCTICDISSSMKVSCNCFFADFVVACWYRVDNKKKGHNKSKLIKQAETNQENGKMKNKSEHGKKKHLATIKIPYNNKKANQKQRTHERYRMSFFDFLRISCISLCDGSICMPGRTSFNNSSMSSYFAP